MFVDMQRLSIFLLASALVSVPVTAQTPAASRNQETAMSIALSGAAIYQTRCAACHESGQGRIPSRQAIQNMTAIRILRTLDFGAMMTVAYPLRRDEREAVAKFIENYHICLFHLKLFLR